MKWVIVFIIPLVVLWSCAHKITRIGYKTKKSDYWDCGVPLNYKIARTQNQEVLGEIVLGDCQKTKNFNRAEAFVFLKREACAIDADTVNILEESDSTTWLRCYKCKAQFYGRYRSENSENRKMTHDSESGRRVDQKRKLAIVFGVGITAAFVVARILGNL